MKMFYSAIPRLLRRYSAGGVHKGLGFNSAENILPPPLGGGIFGGRVRTLSRGYKNKGWIWVYSAKIRNSNFQKFPFRKSSLRISSFSDFRNQGFEKVGVSNNIRTPVEIKGGVSTVEAQVSALTLPSLGAELRQARGFPSLKL
jgi:hypothetical protein